MDRKLDGAFFRVKRGDEFDAVCFSDLTEAEREEVCKDRSAEWLKSLAYHLADRLKFVGDYFDILNGESEGE